MLFLEITGGDVPRVLQFFELDGVAPPSLIYGYNRPLAESMVLHHVPYGFPLRRFRL